MIGNLPRKPLLEFLEKVMLYLNSGNIAKALITVYFRPSSGLERNFADDSVECGYVPAGILSTTKRR